MIYEITPEGVKSLEEELPEVVEPVVETVVKPVEPVDTVEED